MQEIETTINVYEYSLETKKLTKNIIEMDIKLQRFKMYTKCNDVVKIQ